MGTDRDLNSSAEHGVPLLLHYEKQYWHVHGTNGATDATTDHDITDGGCSTGVLDTFLHGVNALSGVGILSIPYALATGGWLSLILFFFISAASFYSGILIKRCMEMHPHIKTYPDIGHIAFGNMGRLVVSVSMYIELYLVTTGFLIIEGDNLINLFPQVKFEIAGIPIGGKQLFVVIVAMVILPSVWLNNLSLLSYVSASGVLASAVLLFSILWTGAFDGIGFHQRGTLINWGGIPTALSLYTFCYCAHPVFPTLYNSMKKKHQFSNVLLVCFVLCTASYASMAIFGYLMFGSEVSSQITLDLPIEKLTSKVAIYTTLVNPIAKYALMITPISNALKGLFPCNYNKKLLGLLVDTSLVISSVIVALAVPFFAYLMSLVGAIFSVTASILLPCLCYLKISGLYRKFGCEMLMLWGIIFLGVTLGVFGTYTSIRDIIQHF